jgi:antitoxin component YwqK of YwqJK toxin-antitoxin module
MKKIIAFLFTMIIVSILQVNAQAIATDAKLPDTVNRIDADGNRIGYWIDKQGETTYKGEYIANKKVKNWIGYYPNNAIFKIEYYNNGLKDGISVQFDRKCKISLVEHYKNGLAHGLTVLYSQYNENPTSETQYTFGKKNGLYRQYYDNTKIQEETMYVNDLKNGPSVWNNKNGQRIAEYHYKDGSFDGIQKTFYENDSLQSINNYLDNKLSGESKEFFRNGKIKLSGKYVNGQKEGAWTEYNELGKAENVIKYKDGVELNKK